METENIMDGESSSDDDSIERVVGQAVMISNSWIWNATQVCVRDIKEVRNDRPMTGRDWIRDILQGHSGRCYDEYRLSVENFLILCDELKQKGLAPSGEVTIEEQVGMFLQIVGHSATMRKVGEDFQHSTETMWRCFRRVLRYIIRMRPDYIKTPISPDAPRHAKVSEGTPFEVFKGALGAIDGTHIPAFLDPDDDEPERFRNRKQFYSQNVMAAVDFDGNFVAVVAGWEGSAHDNLVLRKAVDRGFRVPPGRYYLVDLGYANTIHFLCPYRGRPYHLDNYREQQRSYDCPEDLYNHRHAQLRNIVEKTFGALKIRFKICQWMHMYKYKIQVKVVVACCIMHNFINYQNKLQRVSDESWLAEERNRQRQRQQDEDDDAGDGGIEGDFGAMDNQVGSDLRENIKNLLWANR